MLYLYIYLTGVILSIVTCYFLSKKNGMCENKKDYIIAISLIIFWPSFIHLGIITLIDEHL